jgi:hypothetical protein
MRRLLRCAALLTITAAAVAGLYAACYAAADRHLVVTVRFGSPGSTTRSQESAPTFAETTSAAAPRAGNLQTNVQAGLLSIYTAFTPASSLNLAGTQPTQLVTVVDTRAGNQPWTITALASSPASARGGRGSKASAEAVGITDLTAVAISGNALSAADLTLSDLPPAGPRSPASTGLGGTSPHVLVADAVQADGTIGIDGVITLAPTSGRPGSYTGTITLTLAS